MASYAAKFVAKRLFKETTANKQGYEDPYFESVPATRLGFQTKKKIRKAVPPGLTPQEEKILTKAKRRAYRIDLSLGNLFGTKFGWGAVIGLVPGFGDFADFLLAMMVYRTITSVEPPLEAGVKMKMKINIIIDFVIGLIPFVGDIADAVYKCNTKNVVILEDVLRKRGERRIQGTPQANLPDPSLADEFDYQNEEQVLNAQNGPPPRYVSKKESRRPGRQQRDDRRDYDVEAAEGIPPPRPARVR